MKSKIVLLAVFALALTSMKSPDTGTVFIARKKLYTGTAGAIKVFMDEKLICRINNNAYSVHQVEPGEHKFSVQWNSKEARDKASNELAVTITIEAGKEYYLKAEKQGMMDLVLSEVTANSWPKIKDDLDQDDCL